MSEFKVGPVIKIQQILKPNDYFYEATCDEYPDLKTDGRYASLAHERMMSAIDKRRNWLITQGKQNEDTRNG